ncbi:MAG: S-adenosyl-L-methionine-dependent methyltransferase [Monoraphidium minutum]|nr:MAG: S-adenosyl-L-methionine-dependent methyltransferase [Monoraphidium minutum]
MLQQQTRCQTWGAACPGATRRAGVGFAAPRPLLRQRRARTHALAAHPSRSGGSGAPPEAAGRPSERSTLRRRTLLGGVAPILCCGCPRCGGAAQERQRAGWYDRYFAAAMHSQMGVYESAIAPVKERLFSQLLAPGGAAAPAGGGGGALRLLEIGIGTGPNLSYMARALGPDRLPLLSLTGLDPNPEMQPYARESAAAAGLDPGQLRLVEGSAEAMPFEDGAFDAAVITLVLCSVPSPAAALAEVRRVVAPGGALAIIEHVAAPAAARPLLALGQRVLDPLQSLVADGCHLTRDTAAALRGAGFDASEVDSFEVPGLGILAPHIAGTLRL